MIELLEALRNFQKSKDLGLLIDLETALSQIVTNTKLLSTSRKIPKGDYIYRCRQNLPLKQFYHFESEISYRSDIQNIVKFGRCNVNNSTKFYGSITLAENYKEFGKNLPPGYLTCLQETSSLFREEKSGYQRFTVGQWQAKKDVHVRAIKPPESHLNKSKLANDMIQAFKDNWDENLANQDERDLMELFGNEFSERAQSGTDSDYYLTALFSEIVLSSHHGIAYPSVQAEAEGLNVAFDPKYFDEHFELVRVVVIDFFKFENHVHGIHNFICKNPKDYPFKYEMVNEQNFEIKDIIESFESEGISKLKIIQSLVNQIILG